MGRQEGRAPRVYVASPLGFAVPFRGYYKTELLPALEAAGFQVLDPWDNADAAQAFAVAERVEARSERIRLLAEVNAVVGAKNTKMLRSADIVFAILDGADVDSGTAAEIGYAAACNTPIVGLRTDLRQSGDNEGCAVNLQVEYFIRSNGGSIVQTLAEAVSEVGRLLDT